MQVLTDAPGGSPAWDKDNPWQAVSDFLSENEEFELDPYSVSYTHLARFARSSAASVR